MVWTMFVRAFSVAANAVALAKPPAAGTQKQCVDMILDIEPVANVQSIAVEGDPFAGRRFENHDRDQLLGELPGAVIVGAICEYHWQFIGVIPGTHQVIACGLAGGIGASWVVGRCFGEASFCPKRTEDLIRADVVKAELLLSFSFKLLVVAPYGLKKVVGAMDVALKECSRASNGSIDMAFRCKVQDKTGLLC